MLSAFFAVAEVTVEPAEGCGEFGALPPKLDGETVRRTVSKHPRHDVVIDTAQFLMGTKQDLKRNSKFAVQCLAGQIWEKAPVELSIVEKKILSPRPRKRLASASLFQ